MTDVSHNFDSGGWQFTPEVVEVFDQHVADNVPFYHVIQQVVAFLSDWLAPAGGMVADLGASTGTTCDLIERRHPGRDLRFALYDVEQPMLDAARDKHACHPHRERFSYHRHNITESALSHADADLTIALFTLQFLRPFQRTDALLWARAAARPGTGAIIVAEKVLLPGSIWQEVANEATWDHKAERGIDADTIRTKAKALRGVLVPRTPKQVEQEMKDAGWAQPVMLWRWYQWAVWAAVADEGVDPVERLAQRDAAR